MNNQWMLPRKNIFLIIRCILVFIKAASPVLADTTEEPNQKSSSKGEKRLLSVLRLAVPAFAVLISLFAARSAAAGSFDFAVRAGNGWITEIYKSADYEWETWPVFVSYDWAVAIRPVYFLSLDLEVQLVTFGGNPSAHGTSRLAFFLSSPILPRERSVVRPLLRVGAAYGGAYGFSGDFGSSWKATNLVVAVGATARTGKLFDWVFEVRGSYDFRDESTRSGYYSAENVEGKLLPAFSVEVHIGVEFSVAALGRKINVGTQNQRMKSGADSPSLLKRKSKRRRGRSVRR